MKSLTVAISQSTRFSWLRSSALSSMASGCEGDGAVAPREITFIEAAWELGEWAGEHYYAGQGPDFGAPSLTESEYVDDQWHLRDEDRKLIAIVGRDAKGHVGVVW